MIGNHFCLYVIKMWAHFLIWGKNYFSWSLFVAFSFELEFWAEILSYEMSLLNWITILEKQRNNRKSNPFNTKNNCILKVTACSYIWPVPQDTDVEELSSKRAGTFHSLLPPKLLGQEQSRYSKRKQWINKWTRRPESLLSGLPHAMVPQHHWCLRNLTEPREAWMPLAEPVSMR